VLNWRWGGGYLTAAWHSLVISMQVEIPNTDTTYWCAAAELPQEVQQRQQYVIRVRIHSGLKHSYNLIFMTAE